MRAQTALRGVVAEDVLWSATAHPDAPRSRELTRHLVAVDSGERRTLCGRRVVWLWDYATPLTVECRRCVGLANAGAELCSRRWR